MHVLNLTKLLKTKKNKSTVSSSPCDLSNSVGGGGSSSDGSDELEAKLRPKEAGGSAGGVSGAVGGDLERVRE